MIGWILLMGFVLLIALLIWKLGPPDAGAEAKPHCTVTGSLPESDNASRRPGRRSPNGSADTR
jgi:hypothetical protein